MKLSATVLHSTLQVSPTNCSDVLKDFSRIMSLRCVIRQISEKKKIKKNDRMRLRESLWALLSRFMCLMQSQQGFFQPPKELCCKRVSTYRLVRAKWVRTDNGSTRRAVGVGEGGVRGAGRSVIHSHDHLYLESPVLWSEEAFQIWGGSSSL